MKSRPAACKASLQPLFVSLYVYLSVCPCQLVCLLVCVWVSMSVSICVYSTSPVELKWRPCQPTTATNQNCVISLSLCLLEKTRLSV